MADKTRAIKLTPKQEAFALAWLETGNASEAYRQAYGAKKMTPATINRMAFDLANTPKITARLAELRAPAIAAAQITLTEHLNDLKTLRDQAKDKGDFGAAISAEVNRGKASGLYVTKTVNENNTTLHVATKEQRDAAVAAALVSSK